LLGLAVMQNLKASLVMGQMAPLAVAVAAAVLAQTMPWTQAPGGVVATVFAPLSLMPKLISKNLHLREHG
jgi:hypothetical protein